MTYEQIERDLNTAINNCNEQFNVVTAFYNKVRDLKPLVFTKEFDNPCADLLSVRTEWGELFEEAMPKIALDGVAWRFCVGTDTDIQKLTPGLYELSSKWDDLSTKIDACFKDCRKMLKMYDLAENIKQTLWTIFTYSERVGVNCPRARQLKRAYDLLVTGTTTYKEVDDLHTAVIEYERKFKLHEDDNLYETISLEYVGNALKKGIIR